MLKDSEHNLDQIYSFTPMTLSLSKMSTTTITFLDKALRVGLNWDLDLKRMSVHGIFLFSILIRGINEEEPSLVLLQGGHGTR